MRALCLVAVVSLTALQAARADQEMQKLVDALSGRWAITQENPDGSTARGEEAWYVAPGGTPLIEEYRVKDSHGRDIADYATVWWDRGSKRYTGTWCADFTDEGCTPFTVEWHGTTIQMRGAYSVHGKHFQWREVFEIALHDSFTQTLYIGADGEELRLRGTVHGTRLSGASSASQQGERPKNLLVDACPVNNYTKRQVAAVLTTSLAIWLRSVIHISGLGRDVLLPGTL